MTSCASCKDELKRTFANQQRCERVKDLLQTRTQRSNESITSFVEDVLRLSACADSQATKEKKLRALMKGVKSDIFGGLVRNPPTTVDGFVADAMNIERALSARASHNNRLAGSTVVSTFAFPRPDLGGAGDDSLRETIRDVAREELRKLLPAADRPASLSIAKVVREEVQ